ncbi:MAG: helix-turn-helix domain-containing protein [Rhizobiaceae bacterium]
MSKTVDVAGLIALRRGLKNQSARDKHRSAPSQLHYEAAGERNTCFCAEDARPGSVSVLESLRQAEADCASMVRFARTHLYRDTVCTLCEKTVSLALDIPLDSFQARTRCTAEVALARQIAMYLCHTTFSLLLTEIGLHFRRDRTTVSYACATIEDRRDEAEFDAMISQLESLLVEARNAVALCAAGSDHSDGGANTADRGSGRLATFLPASSNRRGGA